MSHKRRPEDAKDRSDGPSPEDKRRKVPAFKSVVLEVMKLHAIRHLLEPLIRRVVKEEVELALRKHLSSMKQNCGKESHISRSRCLHLKFENSISLPVFTGARIEGEDGSNLRIALVDVLTERIVSSGPQSTAKVEVVVLEGDFDGEESNNWTLEEFRNNIVKEREGKKPLLTGDPFLNLKEGIGMVSEISFTDNSSWTRSRRFRLGARVVDNFDGTNVKEAKTVSFIVRDHRGELYKKHHPPSLSDEVWRLEKIGKDGAFHKRLCREGINTVKDFLIHLYLDSTRLRSILGTGMSAKMWEVTVEHASTCVLDKKRFLYIPPDSQEKTGVVFNVVGQVMGLLSECDYIPINKLSDAQKADALNSVIMAFKHVEDVVPFDDEASLVDGYSQFSNAPDSASSPRTQNSSMSKLLTPQKIGGYDYKQTSASSPDVISSIYSVGGTSGLDDYSLHGIDNLGLRYDQPLCFPVQVSNSLICDTESIAHAFFDEDHLQFFDTDLQSHNHRDSQADLQSAVDGFLSARSSANVSLGKAQTRWTKLFSILRWFSIRRIAARKRTSGPETHRYSCK